MIGFLVQDRVRSRVRVRIRVRVRVEVGVSISNYPGSICRRSMCRTFSWGSNGVNFIPFLVNGTVLNQFNDFLINCFW